MRLERAEALAGSDLPRDAAIARLGEGWVAEEALAISVYCALVARNFKDGIISLSITTAIRTQPAPSRATARHHAWLEGDSAGMANATGATRRYHRAGR